MNNNVIESQVKPDKQNVIKELRKYKGLTQKVFAMIVDINISTVKKLESGAMPLTTKMENMIRKAFDLNDNWVDDYNFEDKEKFQGPDALIWQYISDSIGNKKIAKDIFLSLKEVINIESLNKQEREIYIPYINRIMMDLKKIAADAKKHVRNIETVNPIDNARHIANDCIKLPGYDIKKHIKNPKGIPLFDWEIESEKLEYRF